jgi:small subunit ribosomal protein S1
VKVYVLNVEPERERVGLSIKRLQSNPWRSVEERYDVGEIIQGRITHVVDFGAFVQVEKGLEGLIHVSELASGKASNPRDVLQPNDLVSARILSIDGERRRMGLRLEGVLTPAETSGGNEAQAPISGE